MASIEGYHVNSEEKCKHFLSRELHLIISKDTEYLGAGMYFWDNKSNAKYWFNQRQKKRPSNLFMVISCNISLDKLLDLTDSDIMIAVDKAWQAVEKRGREKLLPLKPGARLDYIRKYNPLINTMTVFKMIAKYEKDEPKYAIGNSYMAHNVKTIYCVKDPEAITGDPVDCTKEVVA